MSIPDNVAVHIARLLLQAGAVQIRPDKPFVYASGKLSPIYCDNRLTLSYPSIRNEIRDALIALIKSTYPTAEAIAGVATAGVPQGAIIADRLGLPFVYVRASPKNHGNENLIEGKITHGQKVVVIEDLISTGGSSLKAAGALRKSGFVVLGMAAIFTYGFAEAERNFESAAVNLHCLSNFDTLVPIAAAENIIPESEIPGLIAWRNSAGA